MERREARVDEPDWFAQALRFGAVFGAGGAIAGLVVGLRAYPPTAWFATLEVGVPAAMLGALVGAVFGVLTKRQRRR